jgi:hypothetical protein
MRTWIRSASIVLVLAIAACTTKPVYNVERSTFNAKDSLSNEQASEAIFNAGSHLGWSMTEIAPGHIRADINVRGKHQASVDINYDGRGYSIAYVDSENLKYDAEKGVIHRNYNSWVQNLDNQIRLESNSV